MKKLFILTLFLCSLLARSQESFRVIYGIQFEGEFLSEKAKQNSELVSNLDGIENFMSSYEFELLYSNKVSIYKAIQKLSKDEVSISETTAKIFIDYDKKYYNDIEKSKLFINQELDGKIYTVDTPQKYKIWEMSSETKTINGYLCYKATSKIRNVMIEAWYCPMIPTSLGPNEYKGLPGLILELKRGKLKYLAKSIEIINIEKIEFPKGIVISDKEFEDVFAKMNSKFSLQK
jgi:GLPGLI family protein